MKKYMVMWFSKFIDSFNQGLQTYSVWHQNVVAWNPVLTQMRY